ncbi:MAG TPA: hypothetical protein VFE20_05585 [Thermoleophilia bacterium]|nr:hypothetical protein [Thermoleophilia bacterium]
MVIEQALTLAAECDPPGGGKEKRQLRLVSESSCEHLQSPSLAAFLRGLGGGFPCFACGAPLIEQRLPAQGELLQCPECGAEVERMVLGESAA